ncbi:MAG: hypothetical protein JO036_04185 [Candidatus Eremiobacteraeota bacterium]|nr:hypothetical protein [Candidatus Eremiobacteraeota bacterium]
MTILIALLVALSAAPPPNYVVGAGPGVVAPVAGAASTATGTGTDYVGGGGPG